MPAPNLKDLAFAKEELLRCKGYAPKFIDERINLSLSKILSAEQKQLLPLVEGNRQGILHYTGFSVLYNSERKVPFVAAYNIDGADKADQAPRPAFRKDPRVLAELQLGKEFYDLRKDITEFEIGHMASNNEMGRGENGRLKAYQTFHFTNSVPQAEKLNSGLWQGLESYIIREAASVTGNKRICVFTGPMLTPKDPPYVKLPSFRIPLLFFKVIVFLSPKGLYSTAFMMSHEKKLIEDKMFTVRRRRGLAPEEVGFFNDFTYKKVFQVNIPFVEANTGLKFSWTGVKKLEVPEGKKMLSVIKGIRDAAEARERVTRGLAPADMSMPPTRNYRLNIVLP